MLKLIVARIGWIKVCDVELSGIVNRMRTKIGWFGIGKISKLK